MHQGVDKSLKSDEAQPLYGRADHPDLKEHESGVSVVDLCRKHGVRRQHLQMEGQARWDGGVGGQAAEDAGE
jgi:hypothetical protein